jgi:quinohemoprotein ethanol dehydrogenase
MKMGGYFQVLVAMFSAAQLLGAFRCEAGPPKAANVTKARILGAANEPGNWLVAGGNYQEQRFSLLKQINDSTVEKLGLAWSYDIPTRLGQEATPLAVDGVVYVSTDGSIVKALDAGTGRLLWSYDPRAMDAMVSSCCGANSRGVAVWKGRVYIGTLDGRLVALDARTGMPIWSVLTVDRSMPYTISGVPRIIDGKVIIGNGGADLGVRGYVTAYDAATGRELWRFYTIPGDPKQQDSAASDHVLAAKARATWSGEFWQLGGGGTVWDSMAYDPKLNLLYIGVDNGSPWNPAIRSPGGGDNLFLSSIVALRADTGEYAWHYQTTPNDAWDYGATQSIILADLKIFGRNRHVLMQASKNGFFYVLDRRTGALLSADKFAPVTWARGIDVKTGRPLENPEARYYKTDRPFVVQPGSTGAHNWQAMAFSPATHLAYFPATDLPMLYVPDPKEIFGAKKTNVGVVFDGSIAPTPDDIRQSRASLKGWLSAWDPIQQREVWRATQQNFWNGGVLATAGNLVFEGNGAGEFVAYRATDGARRWTFDAQTGIVAAPISYLVNGDQYVAIVAGWGGVMPLLGGGVSDVTGKERGPNRLLVFKLGGTEGLALKTQQPAGELTIAESPLAPASAERGAALYSRYCFRCHGVGAVSGGVTPDLRFSGYIAAKESFAAVLLGGALNSQGMVSFGDQIGAQGAEDIRSFLIKRARKSEERKNVP